MGIDLVGTVIAGRYRIERLLGTGRFASVYAATDERDDREVALKRFLPSIAERAGGGRRVLLASKASKRVSHPAVVPVIDGGQDDGVPFLVMELLEGLTLEQEVRERGPMPLPRCLHLSTILLEALAAAHAAGIVHRDLNPANLFLVGPDFPDPPLRILDLGVARDLVDHLAVSPKLIGATRYLAPELLLQPDKTWTATIDVFAAGMVMFLMTAGRLPFDPDDAKDGADVQEKTILLYQSIEELPGPADLAPHVPGPLDRVIRKALSLEPDDRYGDASELLDALHEAKPLVDQSTYVPDQSSGELWRRREQPHLAGPGVVPDPGGAGEVTSPEPQPPAPPPSDPPPRVAAPSDRAADEGDTVLDAAPIGVAAPSDRAADEGDTVLDAAPIRVSHPSDRAADEGDTVLDVPAIRAPADDSEPEAASPAETLVDGEGAAMTLQWHPSVLHGDGAAPAQREPAVGAETTVEPATEPAPTVVLDAMKESSAEGGPELPRDEAIPATELYLPAVQRSPDVSPTAPLQAAKPPSTQPELAPRAAEDEGPRWSPGVKLALALGLGIALCVVIVLLVSWLSISCGS